MHKISNSSSDKTNACWSTSDLIPYTIIFWDQTKTLQYCPGCEPVLNGSFQALQTAILSSDSTKLSRRIQPSQRSELRGNLADTCLTKVKVLQSVTKSQLTIAVPNNRSVGSSAIQDYLRDFDDSRLARHIAAEYSSLSRSPRDEAHAPKSLSISNMGTSMLQSGADRTQSSTNPSNDLPALIPTSSRSSADSRKSSDTIDPLISEHMWLQEGPDGVLEAPEPAILQCPFNFLLCFLTFADFGQWFSHSLTHFRPENPPTRMKCCFCDESFENPNGQECWWRLLEHVELHHRQGENLADFPPNISLIEYLRNRKLIPDADYRLLKTRAERPSGSFGQGFTGQSAFDLQNGAMFTRSVESNSPRHERLQRQLHRH